MKFKPMKHQVQSLKLLKAQPRVFDMSSPGCVSADTEYLTPTGWKRIDKYTPGDKVAQFYPDTREIEFVKPLEYVKRPCDRMIAISPARGTSQRLSHEHRVLFYREDSSYGVMSANEYMQTLHKKGPNLFRAKFCTTFSVRNKTELPLSDIEIRLMVAVIADGHFQNETTERVTIRLKKSRKIQRLREILIKANIDYVEKQCGGQPDFQVFRFNTPRQDKVFNEFWWGASQHQLEIIADELCYWDSSNDKRESNGTRFSTFIEASADFAQYAFSAAKRPSSKATLYRDRRDEGRDISEEFNIHARDQDALIGPGRSSSVYEVTNSEGFKYCFEVPTSFLLLRHNGYIFATGNTGKTFVEITDFAERRRKKGKCLLVLCPKSLIRAAWYNDFKKFAPDMLVSCAYAVNREEAFDAYADVYVTNVDAAKWLAGKPKKFFDKFDTLVIDESSAYKHHTSARSRSVAKIVKYFPYRRLLSGTPNSNGICDLWHQMFLVDDGKRLGKSFFGFRSACCIPTQSGPSAQMLKWEDKPGIENTVAMLIADVSIRHKFEDCVDIPENFKRAVPVQLSPKHLAIYRELEAHSLAILSKTTVTAINGAVLATKLLQTASGAVYNDDGSYSTVDTDRYELVLDLVEERKHSVVFYQWEHQLDELVKVAKARKLAHVVWDSNKPDIEKSFQAGFYRVLFAHPKSAGHGLTLTKGTATIWASPTVDLEHFEQGWKRVHRIGQTERTETIVVVAEGTRDEKVWEMLMNKRVRMNELFESLEGS